MASNPIIALTAISVAGIACQWLAWRTRLPAILFLLLLGIAAGPVSGLLAPEQLFKDLLFPMVSLSVAVILFEGALTLKLEDLRDTGGVVRNLITIGALATWFLIAPATYYLIGLPWSLAFLFGAIVVVTGPTVIIPLLRSVRPNEKIANILRWEGIIIDPIGALFAVLTFDLIVAHQVGESTEIVVWTFARTLAVGTVFGLAAAQLLGEALRRYWIPEYLHNVITLSMVFGVFTGADLLAHEAGLLAVTVMGMRLANMPGVHMEDILDFKESLSLLLISGLFIILAARLDMQQMTLPLWGTVGLLLFIQFVARPIAAFLSSIGSDLELSEKAFIAWVAPRGIVAAAVSSLFALKLEEIGFDGAQALVQLTFLVILSTVILQSLSTRTLARKLEVSEPEPHGVLIIGANVIGRAIAKVLKEQGIEVMLAGYRWENTKTARMEGLRTYFGNVLSEHANRYLDLAGIGRVFAITPRNNLNALACQKFKREFGTQAVYQIQTAQEKGLSEKHHIATSHRGRCLFGEHMTYAMLDRWLNKGGEIRATTLSDEFGYNDYLAKHDDKLIPLMGIDGDSGLHIVEAGVEFNPPADWTIIGLHAPKDEQQGLDEA